MVSGAVMGEAAPEPEREVEVVSTKSTPKLHGLMTDRTDRRRRRRRRYVKRRRKFSNHTDI